MGNVDTHQLFVDPVRGIIVDENGLAIEQVERDDIRENISTIGNGLKLEISSIPNSGYGLFTTRSFQKGEIITFYDGAIAPRIPPSDIRKEYKTHARMINQFYTIFGDFTRNGAKIDLYNPLHRVLVEGMGGASRANSQTGKNASKNNVEWFTVRSLFNQQNPFKENPFDVVVLIYAKKKLREGDELFVSYGEDYWLNAEKGGTKIPQFITREEYTIEQRNEEQRRNRLKRVAPVILVRENEEEKKLKISEKIQFHFISYNEENHTVYGNFILKDGSIHRFRNLPVTSTIGERLAMSDKIERNLSRNLLDGIVRLSERMPSDTNMDTGKKSLLVSYNNGNPSILYSDLFRTIHYDLSLILIESYQRLTQYSF